MQRNNLETFIRLQFNTLPDGVVVGWLVSWMVGYLVGSRNENQISVIDASVRVTR